MQLPLFPLPVFLLPGGKTKLRIFEPRYLRMVSETLKSGSGFGLCGKEKGMDDALYPIGTRVEIYDFENLSCNLLCISILGKDRFEINSFQTDDDGLYIGDVDPIQNWPKQPVTSENRGVADALIIAMDHHPIFSQLNQPHQLNDLVWVCLRWLEILPLPIEQKQQIFTHLEPETVLQLVGEVIKSKD